MKRKSVFSFLAAGTMAMGLLLGAGATSAATVLFADGGTKATGIDDVNIGGTVYDVTFNVQVFAFEEYGPFPGTFFFNNATVALDAVNAINAALNASPATSVGAPGNAFEAVGFNIGYGSLGGPGDVEFVTTARGGCGDQCVDWISGGTNQLLYNADERTWAEFTVAGAPPSTSSIAASSLPSSRSVQVGTLASAFATMINIGSTTLTGCSIAPRTSVAADFAYQTTDAANVPVGTPNTPVDIPAGGFQNYIFGFLPSAPISPTEVELDYDCTNSEPAPVTEGLNTLLLSADAAPVPDIVALAATPTGDGIVNLSGTNGSNAFAVSTVNVGSAATITATPAPSTSLPLALSICETNPTTGACLSAPGNSATSSVAGGATPTYSVFVTATGTVPFDPANNRIGVRFSDAGGVTRGSTSVAVRTQ
jgi:hypothetical protein